MGATIGAARAGSAFFTILGTSMAATTSLVTLSVTADWMAAFEARGPTVAR